jgi:hypothetical protein
VAEWTVPKKENYTKSCVSGHVPLMGIRYNRQFHPPSGKRVVAVMAISRDADSANSSYPIGVNHFN